MSRPEIIFFVQRPTPQRNPVFDDLARTDLRFIAVYHCTEDGGRNWGELQFDHPHLIMTGGILRRLWASGRMVARPDTKVVCAFGYTNAEAVLALATARARRLRIVTRSDTNGRQEAVKHRARRTLKRFVLKRLIGREAAVWTIGSANERYWSELDFPNQVRIPYSVPRPPLGTPVGAKEIRNQLGLRDEFLFLYVGRLIRTKGI
nr:hypothetical protein [Micromonospora sp. DSM 115978]